MPKSRLYDWEGMATMGRQNPPTRWVERFLVLYLCVLAISNRCSKDSSCVHKGLVTNWSHHNTASTNENHCPMPKLEAVPYSIEEFASESMNHCPALAESATTAPNSKTQAVTSALPAISATDICLTTSRRCVATISKLRSKPVKPGTTASHMTRAMRTESRKELPTASILISWNTNAVFASAPSASRWWERTNQEIHGTTCSAEWMRTLPCLL
jgi:hypothetical protein